MSPLPVGSASSFTVERLRSMEEMEGWHFWFLARRELVLRLLRTHFLPGGRVIDVGCGTGSLTRALAGLGHHPVGLDRHIEAMAAGRSAGQRFVQADASSLPFASGSADGLTVLDLLEHVDDRALVHEMYRVLRPGGRVLASVPAFGFLWSFRDEAAGHRRRYRRKELRQLFEECGFRVREAEYYQCLLFPLLAVSRLLGRRSARLRNREDRPGRRANLLMRKISEAEVRAGRWISWPFGSSVFIVGERT